MMGITDPLIVADLIAELIDHGGMATPDGTVTFRASTTATGLIRVQVALADLENSGMEPRRQDDTTFWLLDIYSDAGSPVTHAPQEAP